MFILRKAFEDITPADLQQLIEIEARETEELEFKGALPVKEQGPDRWISRGDNIGEYARNKILREICAFANAQGGMLILGLHETDTDPRQAARLEPLPRCEALAERFLAKAEDVVEPRLPVFLARGLPVDDQGNGYVIFRVGKSLHGPHRVQQDGHFHIRRGEKASQMTVREIKDLVLNLARSGDRVDAAFAERRAIRASSETRSLFNIAANPTSAFFLRASALPVTPLAIPELTNRTSLWWKGKPFSFFLKDGGEQIPMRCETPAREFDRQSRPRLRQLIATANRASREGVDRVLRDDGLAEVVFSKSYGVQSDHSPVFVAWIVGTVVGVLGQVERLRRILAIEGTEFGLDFQLDTSRVAALHWSDSPFDNASQVLDPSEFSFPRYSIQSVDTFDDLITHIVRDAWNAFEEDFKGRLIVDWDEALNLPHSKGG